MSLPELTESLAACQDQPAAALSLAQSAVDAVQACDPDPNSFISLVPLPESAALEPGPLLGCVFSVKDNIDVQGVPTTCGSRLFEEATPSVDARVVSTLKAAGALCIGKNNMHELALGATGVNPRFGNTTNPWDEKRIAGGSSGGSAVAVALRQVHVALGTDSGGSVRLPAAMCGVVGFKPTGGAISLGGVQGAAWSIDHVGVLASTVADVSRVWQCLTSQRSLAGDKASPRIGYLQDESMGRVSPVIWTAYRAAIDQLKRGGADLEGISLPNLTSAPYLCVSVVYPEVASQHHDLLRECPEMYSDDIRSLIYLGELWSARNYLDAQRLRIAMEADFRAKPWESDFTPPPPAAVQPPLLDEPAHVSGDPEGPGLYTAMRFTAAFNVIGYPAVSIPAGNDLDGLPFGLQLVGKPNNDQQLLHIAQSLEEQLDAALPRRESELASLTMSETGSSEKHGDE